MRLLDKIGLSAIGLLIVLSVFSLYIFPKEGATGMAISESPMQKYLNGEAFAESDVYKIPEDLLVRNLSLTKEEERQLLDKYVADLKAGRVSVEVDHIIADEINRHIDYYSKNTTYIQNGVKKSIEPELVRAIMQRESNFNPTVMSKSGAMGLMQIMPATAKWLKLDNPWDIEQNIKAGIKFLADRLTEYNGEYSLALAAYNAGQGNVNKWLKDSRYSKNGRLVYIPYEETRLYVPYILKKYNVYKGQR